MTDREFKKRLKKLGILFIVVTIVLAVLLKYTLASQKAEASIYANSESYNKLYALGIEEEEFIKYLSLFGNLVNSDYTENQNQMNMAANFAQDMCSTYEEKLTENNLKMYDAEIINTIIKEVRGTYIKESLDAGENYSYNAELNSYIQNIEPNQYSQCIEITDISKNEDKIEVTYKLAMLTDKQMIKYTNSQEIEGATYEIKAVIMENEEYMYSKYFVSEIKSTS